MANTYLPVDRDQVFLLPPDMREWLPEDHLAWFVLDVVERVDTSVLHDKRQLGGVGRRGYDPEMLLALLVYAYCTKQRSSRQIERLCQVDVAYRVICGGLRPDHTTIARFRQDHEDHAVVLFTDVLMVCAEAGLTSVGAVAVDGTKMGTDASMKTNRTREGIQAQVRQMLSEAGEVDAEQDRLFGEARGDELPEGLRDRSSRAKRLDAALRVLDEREQKAPRPRGTLVEEWVAAARAAAVQGKGMYGCPPKGVDAVTAAEIRAECARQQAAKRRAAIEARAAAQGRPVPGMAPGVGPRVAGAQAAVEQAKAAAAAQPERAAGKQEDGAERPRREHQANVTDPDSRVMKGAHGWVQGYNAQAAVNEDGVVVAADVTQDHNDAQQLVPMMAAVLLSLERAGIPCALVEMLLFDAGYWSEDNATAPGPDRLINTTKDRRHRKDVREHGTVPGDPPPDASPKQAMEHRLRTAEGAALYAKRGHIVETVFGDAKHNRGFTRFMRRGIDAAKAEWLLITATGNLLKAFNKGWRPAIT